MKAGLAFSNAILGAVHAMSHSLGGYLDLPHGECNAMLLEHVINYNFDYSAERYTDIAEAMNIRTGGLKNNQIKSLLINKIQDLKKDVGIINSLSQKGVNTSDIFPLSEKAIKDACIITNPRKATLGDIQTVYREAL